MKYEAEIDGRQVMIELEQRGGSLRALVGDRSYEAEVLRLEEEGAYLIIVGERIFEARTWSDPSGFLRVKVRDRLFDVKIMDRKQRRGAAEHGQQGQALLTAPMPGKVVRVLVNQGDDVEAGQGVVVVEAMKMQNEIKSPKAGRVIDLRASEGATVNAGQVLAIIE
jgi:biotin carboxyl carrier protein